MDPLKDRETKESGCSWQKSSLTFGCARHKLMTHYVHTGTVHDRAARQASRCDRENEAVSARSYGLSARTIHNRLQKKKISHQCGPPLIGQTMTRRHRLAYVQLDRLHFIWQCVDWNRVSFSGETRFALSKSWDCYVLERDRFGGGSLWFWVEKWVT